MRESTGNALLMTLMTSVVAIVLSFLVGSISYSKSYRIKNHIIDEIEEAQEWNESIEDDVDAYLKDAGYRASKKSSCEKNKKDFEKGKYECKVCHDNSEAYNYCVYYCVTNKELEGQEGAKYYYGVQTYMQLDFPLINKLVNYPIRSQTKTFYK